MTGVPNDPKMSLRVEHYMYKVKANNRKKTLNAMRSKYCALNFNTFHSTANHFGGHFETSAQNDAKMTLNTTISKLPHISFTSPPSPKFHFISFYG